MAFFGGVHRNHVLFNIGVGGVLCRHFDLFGAVHEVLRQFANGRRKCGRKQEGLPLFGQHLHDMAYVVNKAHVQHTIGFV